MNNPLHDVSKFFPLRFLFLCRLWDYLNQREENTLNALEEDLENDRLPSIPPGSVSSSLSVSAASVANISERDWFWLNYEPDIDELDFVWLFVFVHTECDSI